MISLRARTSTLATCPRMFMFHVFSNITKYITLNFDLFLTINKRYTPTGMVFRVTSLSYYSNGMHRSRKFCQRGPTLITLFFSLMAVERIQIPLIAGKYRSTSKTSFKWRFAGWTNSGPALNTYLVALGAGSVLIRNPIAL